MAKKHGKAFGATINSVDVRTAASKASIKFKVDTAEVTNAASAGNKEYLEGNADATLSVDGPADFGAGLQDATMFALIGGGATSWKLKADGGSANAATNPEYQQSAILTDYGIDFDIGGAVTYSAGAQRTGATTRAVA